MGLRPQRPTDKGPHFIDLNLLPPALRPRIFPMLGVVLGLIAAAAVLLLLGLYQFKSTADAEVDQLASDLLAQKDRLGAASGDTPVGSEINKYRIGWSRVLQTIVASLPADIQLSDVAFAADPSRGPMASIKGNASEYAAIVEYADNLRSSPFFSRVSIQSMALATATLPSGISTPGAPTPPRITSTPSSTAAAIATRVPPTPNLQPSPTKAPSRSVPPTSTPTIQGPLAITPTIISSVTPTRTVPAGQATPTPTRTVSRTPTAVNYAYVVSNKASTCDMSKPNDYAGDLISGHVYDIDGTPMEGVRLRVASIYTASPWSGETASDGEGFYRFYLTKYNYKVEVISGSSEVANELWTRSQGEPGACFWQVDFKKNNSSTPVPPGTATVTPTTTPAGTVTPTPTRTPTPLPWEPITGTATASIHPETAGRAVDGDYDTIWSAGEGPPHSWEEDFGSTYSLRGIALAVTQAPDGNTTHVVHLLNESDAEVSGSPITISGYTREGDVIQRTFSTPIAGVRKLKIETTASPSWVAWREIRAYAGPSPTATPSPTPTPLMEPDDTSVQARGIPSGTIQLRSFYEADDVDWGWYYNAITNTMYFRAQGSPSMIPEITLYEGATAPRASSLPCDSDADALLSFALNGNTTYYAQFRELNNTTGIYTITLASAAPACASSVGSLSVDTPSYSSSIGLLTDQMIDWPRHPGLAVSQQPADEPPLGSKQPTSFVILLDIRPGANP